MILLRSKGVWRMGRLFVFALCMMLLPASGGEVLREQVLFSMIFPQLGPRAVLG